MPSGPLDAHVTSTPEGSRRAWKSSQLPALSSMSNTRGFARLPIIALTANVMVAQIDKCRAAGMNDHLGKPFGSKDLLASIARWTQGDPLEASMDTSTLTALQRALGTQKLADFLDWLDSQLDDLLPLLRADPVQTAPLGAKAHSVRGYAGSLGFDALNTALEGVGQACQAGAPSRATINAGLDAVVTTREIIARRAAA